MSGRASANTRESVAQLHGVVLAGGRGHRLQTVVRQFADCDLPKQFCSFGLTQSLLEQTTARVARLVVPSQISVVVDEAWEALATAQLAGFLGVDIVAQPGDRGTGIGLLLALVRLVRRAPGSLVLMTPADHAILDVCGFWKGVLTALDAVKSDRASVVLLAAQADQPRTDYGWILAETSGTSPTQRVARFVEKPGLNEARRLLAEGALWNTMVLVARAEALLDIYRRLRPSDVSRLLDACSADASNRANMVRRAYRSIGSLDLSRDVLATARGLHVVRWPRHVGWSDLGTPSRMAAHLRSPLPLGLSDIDASVAGPRRGIEDERARP